jgi:hypothetical protein
MLLHQYQTLVREIATPTFPGFAEAGLSILESTTTDLVGINLNLAETICDSFSSLVPLYSATFRPFSSRFLAVIRPLFAPTSSDTFLVPFTLQSAARRLSILQHYVAAKTGGADEWAKHIDEVMKEIHCVADQVFRAVNEPSESSAAGSKAQIIQEAEPSGGPHTSKYPAWSGIQAGSQRLVGLLHYLADCLLYSTKGTVVIPVGKIRDTISRICLIARQQPKTQSWEQALPTNAAIGREEKEELWSVLPDIHIATLRLVRTTMARLDENTTSIALELLDHIARVFNSGISLPSLRCAAYQSLETVIVVVGPTLSKPYVETLGTAIGACCRDLQENAGYLKQTPKSASISTGTKKNGAAANADLFLKAPDTTSETPTTRLEEEHRDAASALLSLLLSHLPQKHLKPSLRGLLDQTAVLTKDREAMISSVLNPFTDPRGRKYPSVLPHLTQMYPEDQTIEVLRTNLRTDITASAGDGLVSFEDLQESEAEDLDMGEEVPVSPSAQLAQDAAVGSATWPTAVQEIATRSPPKNNPFHSTNQSETAMETGFGNVQRRANSPPKRKHEEELNPHPPKRQELDVTPTAAEPVVAHGTFSADTQDQDDDDDSDGSVHLNMELEDDEDEDEDEDN